MVGEESEDTPTKNISIIWLGSFKYRLGLSKMRPIAYIHSINLGRGAGTLSRRGSTSPVLLKCFNVRYTILAATLKLVAIFSSGNSKAIR